MSTRFFLFFITLILAGPVWAEEYPGYVSDVRSERSERFYEIYLFMTPPPAQTRLQDEIFNPELSKEFRRKYQDRFGQFDADSITYKKYNYGALDDNRYGDSSIVKATGERRAFAEYMTRRLAEWHVDNYFKSDPNLRPVYEMKDTLSNVHVALTPESKLDLEYSLSGNTLDIIYRNPYLDSKIVVEMDPSVFGPAEVQESRLQLGKNIRSNLRVNTYVATTDGIGTLELVRTFKNNWAASISGSSWFRNAGKSVRDSRTAVGLTHTY